MTRTALLSLLVVNLCALTAGVAWAQLPPPLPRSPEVHPDRRVTFRLKAPGAKEVRVSLEGAESQPMTRDESGVWSFTTSPLAPDYYGYSFAVDGVTFTDPAHHVTKPNFIWRASEVHVPGDASLPWEVAAAPRGRLHRHFHRSSVVGDHRDFYVYTPPGYDPAGKTRYPVLYLLHGFSDDASGWTTIGRAHVILDNLIGRGEAKPMLVVMPFGYGAPEILKEGFDPSLRQRNVDRFRDVLLQEVMPEVERSYLTEKGRDTRALAGLSMGGGQALEIGLNALDTFAWVGALSSAVPENLGTAFPRLSPATAPKLLFVACGTTDFLIEPNRKLHAWLQEKKVEHTWIETPGAHTWMFWRRNLADFAPRLFR